IALDRLSIADLFFSATSLPSGIQKNFCDRIRPSAARSFFSAMPVSCWRNVANEGSATGSGNLIRTFLYAFGAAACGCWGCCCGCCCCCCCGCCFGCCGCCCGCCGCCFGCCATAAGDANARSRAANATTVEESMRIIGSPDSRDYVGPQLRRPYGAGGSGRTPQSERNSGKATLFLCGGCAAAEVDRT